ncbi:MAG: hypothetical protein K2M83_11870 [Muribaculaceae bacterium]|nr:hypothetical protein [Muribaculaceae bacterium]
MKRFITMIVAACAFFAVSAQNPMVTLSHNGELSFFTDLFAFESACNTAENNDTIFLSQGDFTVRGGELLISKRLCIIGNGYDSHILGTIRIAVDGCWNNQCKEGVPFFDGVRLDTLSFYDEKSSLLSYLSQYNTLPAKIIRCWINTLDRGGYAGTTTTYDKCYIEEEANFSAGYLDGRKVFLTNSKINSASSLSDTEATNCNIILNNEYPLTALSCILSWKDAIEPNYHETNTSILNTLFNFKPTDASLYQQDCYYIDNPTGSIFDDNMNCMLNLTEAGYYGRDGKTVVGIEGGESPYSENPSMPTVDTANSSVVYDAENNKLKVSITIKAD